MIETHQKKTNAKPHRLLEETKMVLIAGLLCGLIHLVTIALDVLLIFMLLRLAAYRFNSEWLMAFNRAGTPLVDWLIVRVRKVIACLWVGPSSEETALAFGLLALACVSLLLNLIIKAGVGI